MADSAVAERKLDIRGLLDDLVADGRLTSEDANLVAGAVRSRAQTAMHPLVYIASEQLDDCTRPARGHRTVWHKLDAPRQHHHQRPLCSGKLGRQFHEPALCCG